MNLSEKLSEHDKEKQNMAREIIELTDERIRLKAEIRESNREIELLQSDKIDLSADNAYLSAENDSISAHNKILKIGIIIAVTATMLLFLSRLL